MKFESSESDLVYRLSLASGWAVSKKSQSSSISVGTKTPILQLAPIHQLAPILLSSSQYCSIPLQNHGPLAYMHTGSEWWIHIKNINEVWIEFPIYTTGYLSLAGGSRVFRGIFLFSSHFGISGTYLPFLRPGRVLTGCVQWQWCVTNDAKKVSNCG